MDLVLATAQKDMSVWGLMLIVLIGLVALGLVVLFIAALVSVLRSPRLASGGKAVWVLLVFVFPLLGPLVWFIWGRHSSFDR